MIDLCGAPGLWIYGMFAGYQYHFVCYCLRAMIFLYNLYSIICSSSVGRWLAGKGITRRGIFTAKTPFILVNADDLLLITIYSHQLLIKVMMFSINIPIHYCYQS